MGEIQRGRESISRAQSTPGLLSALTLKRPDQFCSVDQGIYGRLTLRSLAVLAEERGDRAEARRLWRMVLDECPGDAQATSPGLLRSESRRSPPGSVSLMPSGFSQGGLGKDRQSRSDYETALGVNPAGDVDGREDLVLIAHDRILVLRQDPGTPDKKPQQAAIKPAATR